MTRAELKQQAKDTLRGRWGTAIGMTVLYAIIVFAITIIANHIPTIGGILEFIITIPISFGFIGQMLKFSRKEEVNFFDFFSIGFNNFGKSWSIFGNTLLKLLPWLILYILCMIPIAILVGLTMLVFFAELFVTFFGVSFDIDNLADTLNFILQGYGFIIPILLIALLIITIIFVTKSYLYVLVDYIGNDNLDMTGKNVVEKSKELMKGHRWEFFVLNLSFIGWIILAGFTFGIGYLWLIPYMDITIIKFYENLAGSNINHNIEVTTEQ